jgi:hypothetical protein
VPASTATAAAMSSRRPNARRGARNFSFIRFSLSL